MRRSTLPARLITIVFALIATPAAVSLVTTGGTAWLQNYYRYADPTTGAGAPFGSVLLQIAGVALLLGVVISGIWSSAGLLTAGVLSLVPVVVAIAPGLMLPLYDALRGELTRQVIDTLSYGVALFLLPLLGAMGLVLFLVRRRPASGGAGTTVVGLVGAPVLLLAGGVLTAWGHGAGLQEAFRTFRFDLNPLAILAVLGGVALIVAGILLMRWSTFALLLPALVLLALSALVLVPGSARWFFLPSAPELSRTLPALLLLGVGVAAALVFIAFTVVLAVVRRRARAVPDAEATTAHPPFPAAAPYPPAPTDPYSPAQYPPAPPAA